MTRHLLLGQTLLFTGNPFASPWQDCVSIESEGGVLLQGGKIADVGKGQSLAAKYPDALVTDYGSDLICPGFVDAHAHYPQTAITASWGKRLIEWLNSYTFPEEMRLSDPDYAHEIAGRYFELVTAAGTTTTCSYCTSDPVSVEAYFSAARARGMRVFGGKTCMDRNAPEGLQDTAQRAYDESKALCDRWQGKDRLGYVITPRFSPTSTPEQLAALGGLWSERPDCLMQTHISEQVEEIAWVKTLFPDTRDYLDTYEAFGLIGAKALYGHAIHLEPREIARVKEVGAALIHCPTSNTFIGSGLFDMTLAEQDIQVGLATDTGGGSSFSMLRTMAAAYEVGQLRGNALHAAQLLWLATQGSARALHAGDQIGALSAGHEADICVLDLASTAAIAQRYAHAESIWDAVFPTIMMGDDRAVRDVWIGGARQAS
ncbi:MAG: guanine deaminase [Pseudomonadota bacterium]